MSGIRKLPSQYQKELDACLAALINQLGANLFACILYGSAVRGGLRNKVSDLNILIVLRESTPQAHKAIAEVVNAHAPVKPFVLAKKGFEKSFEAFAVKFDSIKRNYRLLHGEDPLAELHVDPKLVSFLTEQALRNLRLRCVNSYITFGQNSRLYQRYLNHVLPQLFTDLCSVLRLQGADVPNNFPDRLPVLKDFFKADVSILEDILKLKEKPRHLAAREIENFHGRLFCLLDHSINLLQQA